MFISVFRIQCQDVAPAVMTVATCSHSIQGLENLGLIAAFITHSATCAPPVIIARLVFHLGVITEQMIIAELIVRASLSIDPKNKPASGFSHRLTAGRMPLPSVPAGNAKIRRIRFVKVIS